MAKKTGDAKPAAAGHPKAPRQRSPNYPSLDLRLLVGKLPSVFEKMKRHPVGVEVAVQYLGYSYSSSTGKLALAAMRAFGLFENDSVGAGATVKLTTRALDIAADYSRESAEWWDAVKKAALSPNIHAQLWQRFGASLPDDAELRRYLVRELKFNDNAVADFILEYKTTIAFANLSSDDKIDEDGGGEGGLLPPRPAIQVRIGSMVQWVSGGVDQFPEPKRVVGISPDTQWVFVEGSPTGLPMDDVFVDRIQRTVAPPQNPHYAGPLAATGPSITFPLPHDNLIEIRLKKPISEKDFERITKLLELSKDSLIEQQRPAGE